MQKTGFNVKNLWKCIFGASKRVRFSYFCKIALNRGGALEYLFRIFVDHVTIFGPSPMYATSKIHLLVTKNRYIMAGNCWLTVVT